LCRRRSPGFTLVELVVVLVVVSILAAVAVERLFYYQERAEKVAMLANLEAFKMGLRIQVAELLTTNRADRIATLEGVNPVTWMEQPPPGWTYAYQGPPQPGSWSYATDTHELVYLPQNTRFLSTGGPGKDLRFKVFLKFAPNGAGGQAVEAATLAPTRPYQWF
jgi:prepilin-type N-terminal cleavage/methylation domain-containing protein